MWSCGDRGWFLYWWQQIQLVSFLIIEQGNDVETTYIYDILCFGPKFSILLFILKIRNIKL